MSPTLQILAFTGIIAVSLALRYFLNSWLQHQKTLKFKKKGDVLPETPRTESSGEDGTDHPGYSAEVEPLPIIGTRSSVRKAWAKARKHVIECVAARKRKDSTAAEYHGHEALKLIDSGLGRDHWYTPEILNNHACVLLDQNKNREALKLFEQSLNIALEWHEQCHYLIATIEKNISIARAREGV